MQDDSATTNQPRYIITVHEIPKFDLTSYISNYKGRTVFRRLHLIASCSTALREEAARLAVVEAKKGSDLRNYALAVELYRNVAGGYSEKNNVIDPAWETQQAKRNAAETHRLENELKGYKNNLIKESIRMGNEDLGTHYYTIGDLGNAGKAYGRMRDYCTTPAHIASTAFRQIAVAVEQRNWLGVSSQANRIRNLQMKPEEMARNQPKTNAAMGLQLMSSGEYKEAANSFLATEPSLGDSYNEVLTSNDVAVYGGLCALASMSRSELQTKVLDNASFRNFLELEPHIRRAISFFCARKYSQCLEILESYRADYLLDIYLQPHVMDIYRKVRTKSIVQYFEPFSQVTLASMEKMFGNLGQDPAVDNGTTTGTVLDELFGLIESGKLDARIDMELGTLVANETNTRAEMLREANEMMDGFIREARLKLLRLNVLNAGIEVEAPAKKKAWDETSGANWADSVMGQQGPKGAGGKNIMSDNGFQGQGYSLRERH